MWSPPFVVVDSSWRRPTEKNPPGLASAKANSDRLKEIWGFGGKVSKDAVFFSVEIGRTTDHCSPIFQVDLHQEGLDQEGFVM